MSSLQWLLGYVLTHGLLLMLFTPLVTGLNQAPDGRCYLREGSSGASFTVSELLSPGGTLGILEVEGNSSQNGDIVLSLQENDMVRIVPETKKLILIGKLDKEGIDGRNQLHVKVRCERKNSNDPPFVIPMRIVVQDANDNAPTFVNAPYVIQLSESMSPGMVISSDMIKAYDRDQPGPFSTIQYSVVPGQYSDILAFQSALAPTLVIKQQLDYETLPNFTVTIKAQDQGHPPLFNTTTLTIRVLDADDQNPRFVNQSYFAILPSTNQPGDILQIEPAPIEAVDQDKDLNVLVYYSFESDSAVDSSYFNIHSKSGLVSLRSAIPSDMTFPVTLVIRATQIDNEDRRDLTTLTVARNSIFNGLRFLSPSYLLSVPENLPNNSILLRLQTNRPFDEFLQFALKDDFGGQFSISESGDLLLEKPLDFEKTEKMILEVKVTSGSMSDTSKVELIVIDVNEHDPAFDRPSYRFRATATAIEKRRPIGQIITEDGDRDDSIALSIIGTNARAFHIDKMGHVFVKNATFLNASMTHLVVVATDSGNPPRRSSVPLEIVVPDEILSLAGVLSVDSTFFLMIIFGVSLGILFIVIIVLAIHIAKRKHQRERVGQAPTYPSHQPIGKMASYMSSSFAHQKLSGGDSGNSSSDTETNPAPVPSSSSANGGKLLSHQLHSNRARMGVENPIFHESPSPNRLLGNGHVPKMGSPGSTSSTDDGACSSSHGDESDEDGETKNNKITVASVRCPQKTLVRQPKILPPQPHPSCTCSENHMDEDDLDEDLSNLRRNVIRFGTGKNGNLELKRSSIKTRSEQPIPKRVKKLSWEDEQTQKPTLLDPEVSVTPFICPHTKSMDYPDLAVYF